MSLIFVLRFTHNKNYVQLLILCYIVTIFSFHLSIDALFKKRKLRWFRHVVRAKETSANTILQCEIEEGRPARQWLDVVNNQEDSRL